MNKRLLISLFVVLMAAAAAAQTPAKLKFLGIPVDGNKTDIILQLKKKGFVYNAKGDYLRGVFNGMESDVRIHENYGKVDRIYIADVNTCSEAQIRIRFNNLLQQFRDNDKYIEIDENSPIPEKEDISFEMTVHNKNYDAVFYLDPAYEFTEEDKEKFYDKVANETTAKIEAGELKEKSEGKIGELFDKMVAQKIIEMMDGQVWFRIARYYGEYYLTIYYDNLSNRPNGEDL